MGEGQKPNWHTGLLFITLAAVLTSLSQLCWKIAEVKSLSGLLLLLGGFFLVVASLLMLMLALRNGPVSSLQPMMAVGFVLSSLLGVLFLAETPRLNQLLGAALIFVGVGLLSSEGHKGRGR